MCQDLIIQMIVQQHSESDSLPNSAYTNSGTGNADYGYVDRGGGDNYSSRNTELIMQMILQQQYKKAL